MANYTMEARSNRKTLAAGIESERVTAIFQELVSGSHLFFLPWKYLLKCRKMLVMGISIAPYLPPSKQLQLYPNISLPETGSYPDKAAR